MYCDFSWASLRDASYELTSPHPHRLDIDELATALPDLLRSGLEHSPTEDVRFRPVPKLLVPPSFFGIEQGVDGERLTTTVNQLNLPKLYSCFIDNWLVSIAISVPSKTRVAIEKTIRNVAIEVYLASVGVQVRPAEVENQGHDPNPQGQSLELTLRTKDSGSSQANDRTGKGKGREVGHDSASTIPPSSASASSVRSQTPSSDSQAGAVDEASVRLQAYANLNVQSALPSSMRKLLSEWTLGTDPTLYAWQAVSQTCFEDEEDSASAASGSVRRHARKPRQREKDPGSQQSQSLGVSASQPTFSKPWTRQPAAADQIASSSQPQGQELLKTQAERGNFGSRQAAGTTEKRKRKRRAAGF